MKTILVFSILFCAIAMPALGELTVQDLEKIRQIIKESETTLTSRIEKVDANLTSRIEKVDTKVDTIDTRLRTVETGVAELRGRSIALSAIKDWGVALCALGALIVSIIALRKKQPQFPQNAQDAQKAVSQ